MRRIKIAVAVVFGLCLLIARPTAEVPETPHHGSEVALTVDTATLLSWSQVPIPVAGEAWLLPADAAPLRTADTPEGGNGAGPSPAALLSYAPHPPQARSVRSKVSVPRRARELRARFPWSDRLA